MPAQSQRPLVNRLLALDPLRIAGTEYTSIDAALQQCGEAFSVEELAAALAGHDVPVSTWQLWRWKRELVVTEKTTTRP